MIPTIGLMIGFYIIARSFEMIGRSTQGSVAMAVRIFSAVAILMSIFGIYHLVTQGSAIAEQFGR